jgi:hypothetical protein
MFKFIFHFKKNNSGKAACNYPLGEETMPFISSAVKTKVSKTAGYSKNIPYKPNHCLMKRRRNNRHVFI